MENAVQFHLLTYPQPRLPTKLDKEIFYNYDKTIQIKYSIFSIPTQLTFSLISNLG